MAGLWPLRLRSLHAGFCAGERVMVSANKRSSTLANTLRYRCQKSHARNLAYLLRFYYASAILSDKI
ncbi:hypothetical protein DB336_12025 [Lacticaseibacillus rhamnosus]|nr:hypothetical protein [Lacticaseibacillus rhamnosus]MCT3152431.1 hypothetical protein [Lacticaseibacillus rhamnosus]MCT3167965.1 hypothetical protein [Lacticaseibacillus rhamnosus]MCT3176331.1 hypothetical protein [Lacticaseibacillus rhamnosus]PTU94626.1 hypothetical protein DB339_12020 [Lacticaseibacillus rhamnosus]